MTDFIHHYLYQDLYLPLWPNILASAVWAVPGFWWGHRHFKRIHEHNKYVKLRLEQLRKK